MRRIERREVNNACLQAACAMVKGKIAQRERERETIERKNAENLVADLSSLHESSEYSAPLSPSLSLSLRLSVQRQPLRQLLLRQTARDLPPLESDDFFSHLHLHFAICL